MPSTLRSSETIESTPVIGNESDEHIPIESSQLEDNKSDSEENEDQGEEECAIKKKRQKTSTVCKDFDEVKPSNSSNPFLIPGIRYSNEWMSGIIATAVMVHDQPVSIVEDEVWMWAFQFANPNFQKVSREKVESNCLAIYEIEKNLLKALMKTVGKISLTIDMWKSSYQVVEYMVVTGHFIDVEWKLQKRVLSFVKVPTPMCGIDVANAIFKCLKEWEIEDKVFSVSVDDASYNDSCLRNLKDNLLLNTKLIFNGDLFHVRCCAHILNLLVQDGLSKIKDVIHNVRESVKYINYNDSRLRAFCDVVEQKHLKERKLIIDCPTRWNSTFQMLSTALKFKIVFSAYKERDPHYIYAPSHEDWEKVQKVCKLLEVFNLATHIISGSEYLTANLYFAEVWRVKQVIDNASEDDDLFTREMATPMKVMFDKYWGECNLLMAIASVLDPRCKFHIVDICFPLIYKFEEVAKANVDKVRSSLRQLYDEYVALNVEESSSNEGNVIDTNSLTTSMPKSSTVTGFDQIMSLVRAKEAAAPKKSELDAYLEESVYIPKGDNASFSALEWWKNNSLKYKVLSKMARDILAIPISIVASESTFSAGGRVVDQYHSRLNEESIEALICCGDWLRHKFNLKRKSKVDEQLQEITLKI